MVSLSSRGQPGHGGLWEQTSVIFRATEATADRTAGVLESSNRMANSARRRATYEELVAVPEPLVAEIIDGELVTQPRRLRSMLS